MPIKDPVLKKIYNQKYYAKHKDRIKEETRLKYAENPEKYREYKRKSLAEHPITPETAKRWHLKKKFKLTVEEFECMLRDQNNSCAICGSVFTEWKDGNPACVDHCHETKVIRSLLCRGCNAGIGNFKENISAILRAADYLSQRLPKI